ncbi:MAG: hypothetical protein JWQ28_3188 [Pedobacter sp.]|jgi:hypothetical protein|nr:hypothetical protein [Pedobacter sp.]
MSKNKEGKFVPPKGKPSGKGNETVGLKDAFAAIDPDKENEITEKYISDTDEQEALIQMRHVNRNVNKGVDYDDTKS